MPRTTAHPNRFVTACALWVCAGSAWAHDGHSPHGSHWHATDLWGFVAMGLVVALAIWQGRK